MNILISGGSGFLGQAFSEFVNQQPDISANITWITRNKKQPHPQYVTMISYDELAQTKLQFDIILNLAGAGIADKRWSDERKQLLMQSRLQPTQAIINYISQATSKPKLLISGSAIGWYGGQDDKPLDEQSHFVADFAHRLCDTWEQEAVKANTFGVPVALVRTGVVIHPAGGMLGKLKTPFKMGMGGQLGNGQQILSWISREDWVRAAWFVIEQRLEQYQADLSSSSTNAMDNSTNAMDNNVAIYNFTAPNPISNAVFTKAVGHWLHRPTFMTLPEFVLKIMFGEMATLLIDGQKVLPTALQQAGFDFKHPTIEQALDGQV